MEIDKNLPLFDRDLSWLSFNYRVLMEAASSDVPVYEKIKFLAIFSSNLDEFFRVRYANLKSLDKLKLKKISKNLNEIESNLLEKIVDIVSLQQKEFGSIFNEIIIPELKRQKIQIWSGEALSPANKTSLDHYFRSRVLAFINPIALDDTKKSKVFLDNRALYIVVRLKSADSTESLQLVNIPSDQLPRFIELATEDESHLFIFLDDMIKLNLDFIFPDQEVLGFWSIKLNRDADLYIEDEFSGDLVSKITDNLNKRNIGAPSRFLYDQNMPKDVLKTLRKTIGLEKEELVPGGTYHNFYDFFQFPNPVGSKLEFDKWPSLENPYLHDEVSILDAMEKGDFLLHFPYESYDYVLRFFNEAAIDKNVYEIRATFYRVASNSLITNALISAARNGKRVVVFMELKARFDEENNIKWAKAMESVGIKIIYSMPGLKVHAKVALVKRRVGDVEKAYAFLGTGNFNEKTASIYADHALFTCDESLTGELESLLRYLHKKKKTPKPKELLISQFNIRDRFFDLIDREIQLAKKNFPAHMIIKVNNLEDPAMIQKLYEASEAGVKIDLIVRGICRLIPGKRNYSENIKVRRIVDRYLEHARIFWFSNNGDSEVYLGSADWMKRNLYYRVEVVFPVKDKSYKYELERCLQIQLDDNYKATELNSKLENVFQEKPKRKRSAQREFYAWLKRRNSRIERGLNDRQGKT